MSHINSIICIDVETGGLIPRKNPITQIAYKAFQINDYKTILEYCSFVQPYENLEIEEQALKYTGTSYSDIMSGIDSKTVVKQMCEDFSKANTAGTHTKKPYLLGHNVGFDIGFIMYLFKLHKVDIGKYLACNENHLGEKVPQYFDTLLMSKQKWGNDEKMTSYNLSACCAKAGVDIIDAHDAMNDVNATIDLFLFHTNNLRTGTNTSKESEDKRERLTFKF